VSKRSLKDAQLAALADQQATAPRAAERREVAPEQAVEQLDAAKRQRREAQEAAERRKLRLRANRARDSINPPQGRSIACGMT
jgi:uncharacterized membrane protein